MSLVSNSEYYMLLITCTHYFNAMDCIDKILSQLTDADRIHLLSVINSHGDNLLHMCVYRNLSTMYVHVLQVFAKLKGLNFDLESTNNAEFEAFTRFGNHTNDDGYSPLTLAAKLGHREIFETIIASWRCAL
jgi:ankyrin repeat protein